MNFKRYTNLSTQRYFYHKFVPYGNRVILVIRNTGIHEGHVSTERSFQTNFNYFSTYYTYALLLSRLWKYYKTQLRET